MQTQNQASTTNFNTFNIMKQYTQNPELNERLNQFDQHLQDTLNCDLVEYKCSENLTDRWGLKYTSHSFYIHSADGNVLVQKLLDETETFWHREDHDQTAFAATHSDGSFVKDNTMIINLKCYKIL